MISQFWRFPLYSFETIVKYENVQIWSCHLTTKKKKCLGDGEHINWNPNIQIDTLTSHQFFTIYLNLTKTQIGGAQSCRERERGRERKRPGSVRFLKPKHHEKQAESEFGDHTPEQTRSAMGKPTMGCRVCSPWSYKLMSVYIYMFTFTKHIYERDIKMEKFNLCMRKGYVILYLSNVHIKID